MVNNTFFFFSRTKNALRLNLDINHWGLKVYQVYSNDDPRMTFNLSMARSDLHILLYGENVEKSVSETVPKTNG